MREMTLAEFVTHLGRVRRALPVAEHAGLDHAGLVIEQEAKALVGTEYPGWPALADSTVAEKAARGQVGRISATDPLFATGELRGSIKHEVEGHTVIVGTPDQVGVYMEAGTSRVPPRPFLAPAARRPPRPSGLPWDTRWRANARLGQPRNAATYRSAPSAE